MTRLTKLALFLLVPALAWLFWRGVPSEQPLSSVTEGLQLPPQVNTLIDDVREVARPLIDGGEEGSDSYYAWQDENGVWQLSDQPPEHLAGQLEAQPMPGSAGDGGRPRLVSGGGAVAREGGGNPADSDSSIAAEAAGGSRDAIDTLPEEARH